MEQLLQIGIRLHNTPLTLINTSICALVLGVESNPLLTPARHEPTLRHQSLHPSDEPTPCTDRSINIEIRPKKVGALVLRNTDPSAPTYMATRQDGGRKRATANTITAMQNSATARQCPQCSRKSALIRDFDEYGFYTVCRWCDYQNTRPRN